MDRLHKLLAHQGLGSRRQIEEMIRRGMVKINGNLARLGDKASITDVVSINGKAVKLNADISASVMLLHKPCGFLVTHHDKDDRRTIFSLLPKPKRGRWVAVGRLDMNTSGLIVICNDGELANRLMHPTYQVEREYHVRVSGHADQSQCETLCQGVSLNGYSAQFKSVELLKRSQSNSWYKVILCEGRNREVRRLWEAQGFIVNRLKRVRFGALKVDIPSGTWRELTSSEQRRLYTSVGLPQPNL